MEAILFGVLVYLLIGTVGLAGLFIAFLVLAIPIMLLVALVRAIWILCTQKDSKVEPKVEAKAEQAKAEPVKAEPAAETVEQTEPTEAATEPKKHTVKVTKVSKGATIGVKFCHSCGSKVEVENAKFCAQCGVQLTIKTE